MMLIDVHSHLDHALIRNNLDEIIKRAKEIGVRHIITNGINPETNRMCLEISRKYDIVKCAMGIYPRSSLKKEIASGEYPLKNDDFDIDEEIDFIRKSKNEIVAISEVGLDFVDGESKEQVSDFQKMIELAQELHKPIVIHSRKAELKCVEMLESSSLKKIVMHCFCGKKSLVKRISDNGWCFSVPATVVRSQQFQELVKMVPLSQLFCETDSPYLSPYKSEDNSFMVNEPSYVLESYKKIAEVKQLEIEEVANNIYLNWQRVFS